MPNTTLCRFSKTETISVLPSRQGLGCEPSQDHPHGHERTGRIDDREGEIEHGVVTLSAMNLSAGHGLVVRGLDWLGSLTPDLMMQVCR